MKGLWQSCNTYSLKNFSCPKPSQAYEFLNDGRCKLYFWMHSKAPMGPMLGFNGWKLSSHGTWRMIDNKLFTKLPSPYASDTFNLFLITKDKLYSPKKVGKRTLYTIFERVQASDSVNISSDTEFRNKKLTDSGVKRVSSGVSSTMPSNGVSSKMDSNSASSTMSSNWDSLIVDPNSKSMKVDSKARPMTVRPPKDTTKNNP